MKKHLLKLHLRHLLNVTIDRLQDLWNIILPIFLTSGILVASIRFWFWVFWS